MKVWIICCSLGLSVLSGIYSATQGEARTKDTAALSNSKGTIQQFCVNFTSITNQQGEFYSPFYPKTYPNNTDCIHILKAPKGHSIRIDFRDDFHIEGSSDCQYDFLEIRDGPFGYSSLFGRYCGKNHPAMIESSGQYIWMRFQSDDIIQYSGFKAVYEFYPTPASIPVCRIDIDSRQLEISVTSAMIREKLDELQIHGPPKTEVDCTFVLNARTEQKIFLHWNLFEMSDDHMNCEDSFLSMYEGTTQQEQRTKTFCGRVAKDFNADSNHVYLRLYAKTSSSIPKFDAMVTLYTKGPCDPGTMFTCGGDACVDKSLTCNGRVNCEDSKDELVCQDTDISAGGGDTGKSKKHKPLMSTYHVIILSVVGSVLLSIILISTCATCRQHKKEQQRRKHALQQERQAIEHEMTTLINSPRPGHLRSQTNNATQGKPNGIIPGTSRNDNNGYRHELEPFRTQQPHGRYIENHIGQNGGGASNGGNGYTRYLKVKDKQDEIFFEYDAAMVNKEYCDSPHISHGDCMERSRLRRTLSDRTKHPRSRTPSPRPDVVQIERVPPLHINHHSKHSRALSADRLLDRSRHDLLDNHKSTQCGEVRQTPPLSNKSDCYLPYKCSENLAYDHNQGKEWGGGSASQRLQRKAYDATEYPALDYSPRLPRHTSRMGSGQYVHLDPGYRTSVKELQEPKELSPTFSGTFGSENMQNPQDMYHRSGGIASACGAGSGTYAQDILEPRSTAQNIMHSPAHGNTMAVEPSTGNEDRQKHMLGLTDCTSKVSRTPSIDYKQAPIVPERGSSNASTLVDSQNYATVQSKQGRTKKTDSPDIFYTRPKPRSELRHEDV